jgi:membrane associated rhomboid family serine protease
MFFIPYGTREAIGRLRFPYVTWLLVGINVLVFLFQAKLVLNGGDPALASFINHYAVVPRDITDGTPVEFSLIAAMFMHAGLLHIVGNMLYLLPFGDNVEDRLGHLRYLSFYLLCGIIASLVYVAFNPHSTVPLLGASGAIAGVLGGYLALHPKGIVKGFLFLFIILIPISLPAVLFIGYWFIMQLFSSVASLGTATTESGNVAFLAHVGGFIAGLILAPIFAATAKQPAPKQFETTYSE